MECNQRKALSQFIDPKLSSRKLRPGQPALSHVCAECRLMEELEVEDDADGEK